MDIDLGNVGLESKLLTAKNAKGPQRTRETSKGSGAAKVRIRPAQ